ncbi:uncharacterized protein CEXT_442721 [Caerostris extrusa]|uniref:Uncharacterized protein n=1 Tax=Caerostris extrusa TaxID=172846 RepID=A0AAV4PFS0_CAEEX|nr:uncharacterized protein CEXT_442721 [Caerostris extrusa]
MFKRWTQPFRTNFSTPLKISHLCYRIADIKQAFLQLSVRPEDRNFLRFLWWNTEDRSKLEFFRHCRVVFEVTSSPFLLNATIRHHLDSTEYQIESLQATVKKLKRGFYVDNLTISVENQQELLEFKAQTMKIMNAASFELRCWAHTGTKHSETQNVLGLKWDTETDELYCVSPETDMGISDNISKRKLLSIVNSIYDPIGFTSPATLLPKLLLQETWRNKLDWDEELTLDIQLRYRRWAKHIALIEKCRIPRRILYENFKKATLHIFTDASAHGYACCSFYDVKMESAEEALIRIIQSEWPTDIQEKYAQTIQFYEENKILKVKSRLILREDPEDFVRPTVLPDHPIVRRLIDYVHQKLQHAGVQTTLSHLRERF